MRNAAIALLIFLAGCSEKGSSDQAKSGATFHGAIQDRSSKSADEALFVEKCGMCHRQIGMGTVILARRMPPEKAMLETRDDLTVDLVQMAARQGIGNMPRIRRGEVSDEQLGRIANYLSKATH